ncbi:MAG: hypothetical protein K6G00_05060 [Treponema sp.]|nr:hypothetical protein [Treponema sp.]
MPFISITFAIFFLILVIVYHFVTKLKQNALVLQRCLFFIGSLVFYSFANIKFLPFLLYIILISYFAGLLAKKIYCFVLFILLDLAPLLFFKYGNSEWIFPLGLSFITFQSLSYIADSYTGKIETEKNILDVALFISFFPVISSGPIQRAGKLIPQFKELHKFEYDDATDGMKLFAWGMFKKLFIADRIAPYVNYVYGGVTEQYGLALLFATILYSFQIYCDFSGYTDMATGIARYLGIDVGKNFDHPYFSKSVGEFWRRWHISLSSWLRDYVYIPLGGSRVALPRIYLNLLVTFLVSGIWHGSTWNFVVWGLLHGVYICIGRVTKRFWEKVSLPRVFRIFITFCLVTFAWIFFRADNLQTALVIVRKIMHVPFEINPFIQMCGNDGIKQALHVMFSMLVAAGGAIKGMVRIFILLVFLCCIEFMTIKKNGLEILRTKNSVVRWGIYIVFIVVLLEVVPLKIIFEEQKSYSTNFIYQNF